MSADRTSPQLDFTWDPVKAASNVTKHSVTFAQAATVMLDPLALTVFDAAHSDFEERWFTLGRGSEGSASGGVAHAFSDECRQREGPHHLGACCHAQRARTVREPAALSAAMRGELKKGEDDGNSEPNQRRPA